MSGRRSGSWIVAALLGLCAVGCPARPADPPATEAPSHPPQPEGALRFEEGTSQGGASLRKVALGGGQLTLELLSGREGLRGVAFQLEYDPAVLRFAQLGPALVWPQGSLFRVTEAQPGILLVALTAVGQFEGLPAGEVSLATLHFDLEAERATPLFIRPTRSLALGQDGEALKDYGWSGGRLVRE